MANRKSELWNSLKDAGWKSPPSKSYVNYTEDELELEINTLLMAEQEGLLESQSTEPETMEPEQQDDSDLILESLAADWPSVPDSAPETVTAAQPLRLPDSAPLLLAQPQPAEPVEEWPDVPRSDDVEEIAGLHMRTHGPDDPVRIDSIGRIWYQDEVRKPATAKPRARSVLSYIEPGTKTIENRNKVTNLLEESFEVAGDESRPMQVKVTLPSWQVGIYKDPRLPFRVHVYNTVRGFDRMDLVKYFGGMDQVPSSIKIMYVGGDLCYDINSTRDTLERLLRETRLQFGTL